jgi:endonuclease/exonuclease/phosphatase (EEP) superfamily protein YafD
MIEEGKMPLGERVRGLLGRRVSVLVVMMALVVVAVELPVEGWLMELLRQFRLWGAGTGLVLAVVAMGLRMRWWWVVTALVLAGWQGWPLLEWRRSPGMKEEKADVREKSAAGAAMETGGRLTVVTCNLLYEMREPGRMIELLGAADADVLVLLEFTREWDRELGRELWGRYPYRVAEPQRGPFGICLASRVPLSGAKVEHDREGLPCVAAVVEARGMRVGLLGVHPMPPIRPDAYGMWREGFASWPGMLARLGVVERVVVGDFNATPFCRTFRGFLAEQGLRETSRGYGLESTWFPGRLPFGLPLDHVLVSDGLRVRAYGVGPEAGSDHRWVRVELGVD